MSATTSVPIGASMVALASGHYPTPILYGADGRQITPSNVNGPLSIGPGMPLPPRIAVPNYPPREYQYTPLQNLYLTPREENGGYSFKQLRAWAKLCPLWRVASEYREKQLRSRSFEVVPAEDMMNPDARKQHEAEIKRCSRFLARPNRVDRGLTFSSWVAQAVNECFVTDALVFHKQWHRNGDLSYVQVNGETIKILIDEWGHNVAFQQILWGYPATQYAEERGDDDGGIFEQSEMAYWVYKPRVDSSYGTSPLEEILPIILTAIKRTQAQLDWYTEGTVPDAFLSSPEGWTAEQITKYQLWMDNELSGSAARRKVRMIPFGTTYTPTKPYAYTKDEEEAIASIILAYMGVPKMVLVAQVNRGEADAQQKDSADVGLQPFVKWWEENLTGIVQDDLGAPDLKVICTDGLEGQNESATKRWVSLVQAKILTEDEVRAELGKSPLTAEQRAANTPPALMPFTGQEASDGKPAKGIGDAVVGGEAGSEGVPSAKPAADDEPPAAKAERAAWRRFALKRWDKREHVAKFHAAAIEPEERRRIAKALTAARTREDVLEAFAPLAEKKLSAATKATAEERIKRAAERLFAAQYKAAKAIGVETLEGNANA